MAQRACMTIMLVLVTLWLSPGVATAGVNVNVNVDGPPVPHIVLPSAPRLVIVPGSPVYYAPAAPVDVFVYHKHYYTFHDGAWFHARSYRGPWSYVAVERVPRPVVAVPVKYYKVPPGHAKKLAHGHDACPPGHAKHGRC